MNEEEDLELLALQRQLDDAFQTTRPRANFEEELWSRMQARRPIWPRFRQGVAGLVGSFWGSRLPSVAAGLALIVLIAAGIFTLGKGPHGGGDTSAGLPISNGNAGQAPQSTGFGPLPRPLALAPAAGSSGLAAYAGAATLVWAGNLQVTATALPVYRYTEPSRAEADALAARLSATPLADVAQGGIGVYAGRNFTLVVLSSVAQPPREPYFNVSDLKTAVPTTGDSVAVATAYLAAHHLLPTWPYQTDVQTLEGTVRVDFLRSFDVPELGSASLVDSAGNPYGTEVDFVPGTPGDFERVPLPLTLDPATYPIISANQAIIAMGAASAPSGGSIPVVRITKAELVYTLVWAGDHSYYEPAYLFSGTFSNNGVPSVKRILIPAVAPSFLAP